MNTIVLADRHWGIGYQNRLLISIPSDMHFFRQKNCVNVVIMGRKTLESFPRRLPLKKRVNIVLTRNKSYQASNAILVHSRDELLEEVKQYDTHDIYVIGGGVVYDMLLPYCDTAYVTKINFSYQVDTWFPNLDKMSEWRLVEESEEQTCFDVEFTFRKYIRKVGKL